MSKKRFPSQIKLLVFIMIAAVLISPLPAHTTALAQDTVTTDTTCRFGIDAPLPITAEQDLLQLGVGSLLDWGAANNPTLPEGIEYIRVLRLRNDLYPGTLANLAAWVGANPGSVWVVGNEPDTTYEDQDALLPEVYADRYYEVATTIRQLDRTAQIGFGSIVQPTPIRMRYLQRAWNRLVADAGSTLSASRLVDIWTPHSFILNEAVGEWGTGVPPGFENDHGDAVIITDFADTYSISIFMQRIINFRVFMASLGERNKPLWITEYGSLFPSAQPPEPPYYYLVDENTTALYMWNTFNFLLTASEHQTGMPADANRLVQRWYWYSLNDHLYHFGGSIYNPDYPNYGPLLTLVGLNLKIHQEMNIVPPDLLPESLTVSPISFGTDPSLVNYRLDTIIGNNAFDDATCGTLRIYDGDPNAGGTLVIGPVYASAFLANNGTARVTSYWEDVVPLTDHTLYVCVDSVVTPDVDPSNNCSAYGVTLELPTIINLPIVLR